MAWTCTQAASPALTSRCARPSAAARDGRVVRTRAMEDFTPPLSGTPDRSVIPNAPVERASVHRLDHRAGAPGRLRRLRGVAGPDGPAAEVEPEPHARVRAHDPHAEGQAHARLPGPPAPLLELHGRPRHRAEPRRHGGDDAAVLRHPRRVAVAELGGGAAGRQRDPRDTGGYTHRAAA